jgi:hypothetical protein
MSKKFPLSRLSKWLFSRIIIDQRTKTIKAKQILEKVKSIIKTRKKITVLLLIVKTVLDELVKHKILKIQINCQLNLDMNKMDSNQDKITKKSQVKVESRWVAVVNYHLQII